MATRLLTCWRNLRLLATAAAAAATAPAPAVAGVSGGGNDIDSRCFWAGVVGFLSFRLSVPDVAGDPKLAYWIMPCSLCGMLGTTRLDDTAGVGAVTGYSPGPCRFTEGFLSHWGEEVGGEWGRGRGREREQEPAAPVKPPPAASFCRGSLVGGGGGGRPCDGEGVGGRGG